MLSQSLERRKRVVLDTSVLLSATLVDGAYRKLVRRLLEQNFEICIPQEVIEEYREFIQDKKFQKYYPLFTEIFEEYLKSSIILPLAKGDKFKIPQAQEDQRIINCCTENGVDYLVTADRKTLGIFNGLEVLHAEEFYYRFLED